MKSVGESMAMGRNFEESLQKALRSLEKGWDGLVPFDTDSGADTVRRGLSIPTPERILYIGQAFRLGMSVEDIHAASKVDSWFLQRIKALSPQRRLLRMADCP